LFTNSHKNDIILDILVIAQLSIEIYGGVQFLRKVLGGKIMSKVVIGILAILWVYCVEIIICCVVVKLLKKLSTQYDYNGNSTYISTVRALHVVALIGVIYFVPLVVLVICLAINSLLVGPIIFLILGSTIFVTNKIIIPASESKHRQLAEKYYGKDSMYTKLLNENQQK